MHDLHYSSQGSRLSNPGLELANAFGVFETEHVRN